MKFVQVVLLFIALIAVVFSRRHKKLKLTCTKEKGKGSQTLYKMVDGKNTAYCGCNHHTDCTSDSCNTTKHVCN